MSETNRAAATDAALAASVQAALAGRYRIDRVLGAGAMGVVFRASDVATGQPVAIKTMRPALGYDDGIVARFRIEGEALEQLHHDHIVRVLARGEREHILWIAMDLIEGDPLTALIKTAPVPWRRAASLLAQAADALCFAHERGIIHRDIKPANLLLAADDHLMITDFGIARIVGTERLTATGMTVGTPSYMSPEQIFLDGEVEPSTDQYSLGVVTARLLGADAPPMTTPGEWGGRWKHARWRRSLASLACPTDFSLLMARMSHRDPRRRWSDLDVVRVAARAIAENGVAPSLGGRRIP